MKRFFAVASAMFLSVFLIAPTIASAAAEEIPVDQQQPQQAEQEPMAEQQLPDDQQLPAEDQQPPAVVVPVTPQAVIDWHDMEAARRANRDAAAAMRQQLIRASDENQPPAPAE